MSSFLNNLFYSFSPNTNYSHQDYQPHHQSLLGTGPRDWLSNAGSDYLLNRHDENYDNQVHYWRNAGLAGALALGFQYYKNNHQQPSQYYTQPYTYGYGQLDPWNPYGPPYYRNYNHNMTHPYAQQPMGPQCMTYMQPQMTTYSYV